MPVYREMRGNKKLKGKWRVRVAYKGRKLNRTVTGSKAEAVREEAAMLLELVAMQEAGKEALPVATQSAGEVSRRPPVKRFCDFCLTEYSEHAKGRLAGSTWRVRRYHLATLTEYFGSLPLTALKTRHVEDFKDNQRARGLESSTINDHLKTLSAVLGYAEDQEYINERPRIRRFPEVKKADKRAWSEKDVERLLEKVAEVAPHIYGMVVCLAQTGMRKGEVINLQWRDVDLEERVICIQPHDDWHPKGRRPRTVPITEALLPFLSRERASDTWVFPSPKTKRRYFSWPQRYFDLARKAAGLEGGPHQLRHFYATHMVLMTRDLFLVSRLLGHAHYTVTERYAHLMDEHLDRAREAFSVGVPVGCAEVEAAMKWGVDPDEVAEKVREKVRTLAGRVRENEKGRP
jgi:integrase